MVETPPAAPESTVQTSGRHESAMRIVRRYVLMSAAAGVIPLPGLDVTVLAGIHIALIKELTEHYGAVFSEYAARNIVIAVATSVVPGAIGSFAGRRLLRVLPFITPGLAVLTWSASSAAVSYALGRVIMAHFETGGTLDSFDTKNLHRLVWWRTPQPALAAQ
jgi:uncharacterized protein (DUF697 family)